MPNSKKRILHFVDSAGVYGAEQVMLNLSQQMKNNEHYESVIGCIVGKESDQNDLFDAAQQLNIEAIKVPIANALFFRDIPRAARLIKKEKIDLIHSHGYKPSVYGSIIYLLTLIPIMATCHLWFESSKGPLKMRVMTWIEKRLYRLFPKVIAVSKPIQEILLTHKVKERKTAVIKNGVEIPTNALSDHQKETLKAELGINKTTHCVLNAGRLTRQKAQWTLIESAASLKAQGKQVRILIVGEGGLKQELETLIQKLNVSDVVSLLGFRSDMDHLLEIADVFALPSLDEGMPMALLEACAAKTPVITTPVGDIPKLIKNNETGLLIEPEDEPALTSAITQVCENKNKARVIANNAFIKLEENYSSSAMCKDYIQIYSELLSDKEYAAC
ncbi:glycosyltransferase family 4 protein [Alkalimarinus coralli]|uniref:glycosyltransferase family 4 protein n=1 Tax=Alkalimarinus coralli TaxID=2935863 RepID=UPI00202B51B0|nr:glycosyltransferase family 4 protein [Alkalimarinus coralli]